MLKLNSLLSIAIIILLFGFYGCKDSTEIISPEPELEQTNNLEKITITPININSPGEPICIQLVAGKNIEVGDVCIDYLENSNKIKITYSITEPGWTITKTHIAAVRNPILFPRKWTLQPKLANFPYKGTHNNVTSVEYIINAPNNTDKVYLAIHAKVEGTSSNGDPVLIPDLPSTDVMTPVWMPSSPEANQYIIESAFASVGTHYGWSIDNSRLLGSDSRSVQFLSSYADDLPICNSFIEKPENLSLVNWIINHRETNWDRRTVQAAIWKLLNPSGTLGNWFDPNGLNYMVHDVQLRETIISLAFQNGEDYEPGCGDKVLILAYGPESDACDITKNIVGFEFPVDCESRLVSKNAWAFPFSGGQPILSLSKRFSWIGWARYINYVVE